MFLVMSQYVQSIRNQASGREVETPLSEFFSPERSGTQLLATGDTEMLPLLSLMAQSDESRVPITWGASTGQVFVHWIPRVAWPGKPRSGDELLTSSLLVDPSFGDAPRQYSPLANFYLDFRFLGCFVGMLFIGLVARLQWAYLRCDFANPSAQYFYALLFPFWISFLRGSLNEIVPRATVLLVPALLLLYFSSGAHSGNPLRFQRQLVRGRNA